MLPSLFAVRTESRVRDRDDYEDYTEGRLSIFQAREIRDGRGGGGGGHDPWIIRDTPTAAYRISPYRIHTGGDRGDPSDVFVMEGRFGYPQGGHAGSHVTLFNEEHGPPPAYDDYSYMWNPRNRAAIYRGHWRYSGCTAFSMYCAAPIPIIVLTDAEEDGVDWPRPYFNRVGAFPGDRTMVRVWARRWDPAVWRDELEDAYESRRRRAPPPAAVSGGGGAAASPSLPLPKFVADLIIADAVAKGTPCPITMEPLRADKAVVTPCYHIFDTEALIAWAASQDTSTTICPQCRKDL